MKGDQPEYWIFGKTNLANAEEEIRTQRRIKYMITLFRWILLKHKEIKWKLAFWHFADKQLTEIMKHPEEIEKRIMPYLAEFISKSTETENISNS